MITWITGNSGSGKTTLANSMRVNLTDVILDGDAMRNVWQDLGFSEADRRTQNVRVARLALELERQGFHVIVATICPYRTLRAEIQKMTGCNFIYLKGGKVGPEYPYEK
ncbi:MAG TPA: adenylyl-sulfate kinase [Candidatus Paceibacterota bacterium]